MRENTIYWLTDRTLHESLPVKQETYRQFFRLVTSSLSVWFPEHSTANRLGTVPDAQVTTIVEESKFSLQAHLGGPRKQSWRVICTTGAAVFPSKSDRVSSSRWSDLPV